MGKDTPARASVRPAKSKVETVTTSQTPRAFDLRLIAVPGHDCPERSLRAFLKRALRGAGFRCVRLSPVDSTGQPWDQRRLDDAIDRHIVGDHGEAE